MNPDIQWIAMQYGFDVTEEHFAFPESARNRLPEMYEALAGTDGLVAIFIPDSSGNEWNAANQRGRVVDAVRLLPMPAGQGVDDFPDFTNAQRWPVGWPFELVYAPLGDGPRLQDLVESVDASMWPGLVSTIRPCPQMLAAGMRDAFNNAFADFQPVH